MYRISERKCIPAITTRIPFQRNSSAPATSAATTTSIIIAKLIDCNMVGLRDRFTSLNGNQFDVDHIATRPDIRVIRLGSRQRVDPAISKIIYIPAYRIIGRRN